MWHKGKKCSWNNLIDTSAGKYILSEIVCVYMCENICSDTILTIATSPTKVYTWCWQGYCIHSCEGQVWLQDGCSTEAGCLDSLILAQGITVYFILRMPNLSSFQNGTCAKAHDPRHPCSLLLYRYTDEIVTKFSSCYSRKCIIVLKPGSNTFSLFFSIYCYRF